MIESFMTTRHSISTAQDRIDRLTLFKETTPDVAGLDAAREQVLGITDMFVLPTGKGDGR